MKKAFSLIEVMIVVVILGLIASLVVPNLIGQSEQAKKKLVCIQMKSLKDALDSFKIEEDTYPSTQEGLESLITNPNPQKYKNYPEKGFLNTKSLPKDPWGNEYIYINDNGNIEIISLGADGKEGGSGENKDIKFSECVN
ncbi:general secretion pathway protein G [Nautilia profundicola AmH]|uniref:Type II secretion system core protein G n=1 Tax=Nautilia profundicola (strain ATCC BAA-1463 / DSM 18972 / AmH) TaxID=598659 RepID=B9L748_NAUPA|nr:type II secretion system major pseudopilin GspG [Nautilia profundicola]ACM92310.1 general secretion pathway protein G [Nautilia profundicola AmH]